MHDLRKILIHYLFHHYYNHYNKAVHHLLIGEMNSGSKEISIQITDVEPDGMQFLHSHEQEQCYYIISGTGLMMIDDEAQEVNEGDAVFIPSDATHGIKNIGHDKLTYLTANRAFGKQKERNLVPEGIYPWLLYGELQMGQLLYEAVKLMGAHYFSAAFLCNFP